MIGSPAKGSASLTFDNLGEAAEIELGARPQDGPLGDHPSARRALPAILDALGAAGLAATFFVEGLNAEIYPELLREIEARGHEVGYHAWRHERWGGLEAGEQAGNLARGLAALGALGLDVAGMRPPGGELGAGGLGALREAGLRYCSPAGGPPRTEQDVAVLPFRWSEVDAACVLPDLGPPREPAEFLSHLERELERATRDGDHLEIVLHPFMLEWFGEGRLGALLGVLATAAGEGELRVEPCRRAAERLLSAS
jgi:peptidoglycan/xylan/chitin deacetylase (PgdA/CDA1 family)